MIYDIEILMRSAKREAKFALKLCVQYFIGGRIMRLGSCKNIKKRSFTLQGKVAKNVNRLWENLKRLSSLHLENPV